MSRTLNPLLVRSAAAMPAELVEQLVGETGEPDRVIEAARGYATRSLPALRAAVGSLFPCPVQFDFRDARVGRFAQAKPAPSANAALVVVASDTSPDAMVVSADASALAIFVAAIFGADEALAVMPLDRAPTQTETDIVQLVFEAMAETLNGSGERALALRLPIPPILAGKALDARIFRDGPAVSMVFAVGVPGGTGEVTVTLPQRVLLQHRAGDAASAAAQTAPAWRNRFSEEIMRSAVELTATVAMDRLTLGDLADLQVGQVIALPKGAQSTTLLAARGRTLFTCEFGKLGHHYTVRLSDHYDAGKEFIDGLLPELKS